MSNIYYRKIDSGTPVEEIQEITQQLLEEVVGKENIKLEKEIPLKVHFGEKGNKTFIKPENYNGIINYLKSKNIKTSYIETTVMYGGQRCRKDLHLKTAAEHGFNQIPVIIADGEDGGDYVDVSINKKHFKECKLGEEFLKYNQIIVLAHFKGHMLAGFGGAIKQLGMGFASKGGKLAMHMDIKPKIKNKKCKRCHLCEKRCAVGAITIAEKSFIDHEICVGCGACVSICPNEAVSIMSVKSISRMVGFGNPFREKLMEYAYAAHMGKRNIYLNFLMNITSGCDCETRKMKILMDDIGVLASTDPVALDQACYDLVKQNGKKFRGINSLEYAEKIGIGSRKYNLVQIQH